MYIFTNDNEWFTEHCLICGSVNHIFLSDKLADAWECWSCFNRWWLDDIAEDMFIIENDVDEDEADDMLVNAHHLINFLHGHSEKQGEN